MPGAKKKKMGNGKPPAARQLSLKDDRDPQQHYGRVVKQWGHGIVTVRYYGRGRGTETDDRLREIRAKVPIRRKEKKLRVAVDGLVIFSPGTLVRKRWGMSSIPTGKVRRISSGARENYRRNWWVLGHEMNPMRGILSQSSFRMGMKRGMIIKKQNKNDKIENQIKMIKLKNQKKGWGN